MVRELQSALRDRDLSKAEYIRVQAVLMRKLGQKRSLIAALSGKSLSVIEDWITAYNHYGLKALRTHTPKQNNHSALSFEQRQRLISLLKKKPQTLGIGHEGYWSMPAVKQLVVRETGIVYRSVNSYRKLLNAAGLSYQKVEFVDKHRDSKAHKGFRKQFEAKIKKGNISMWW